jgi:tripartite ATP-independent transporter DctM subunit
MFFVMFGLIAIELPVAFALVTAALTWLLFGSPVPMSLVVQRMSSGIDSFPLLAIPLFVLAGNLMNVGGIAARIFEFAVALVGHLRGGLAQVNIFASLIFAGMSGVAQADAAGLGTVEIKAMKKEGFDAAFAAACSAASAIVGPIIPPSVIMVVYGVLAQVSISDLFLAGLVPGFFIGGLLMLTVWFLVATGRVYAPVQPKANAKALGRSFVRAIPPLMAPVILVAGLLSGVATPTELGAITVVYAIVLGFAYRELNWKRLYN